MKRFLVIGVMAAAFNTHANACVAVDAPQDIISAMSGKLGLLAGVNAKTAYSNVTAKE